MMRLLFLQHSGFLLETERHVLLFDYYDGTIPPLPEGKDLLVFVSHGHYDHFNEAVFALSAQYGRERVRYVLSWDIDDLEDILAALSDRITFLKPHVRCRILPETMEPVLLSEGAGGFWQADGPEVEIETFRSNDAGLAWLIRTEGRTIWHSGDLQWWDWPGEPEAENRHYRETFQAEIRRIAGKHVDLAMLVLDPRQKESACLGIDWFLSHVRTGLCVPMHSFGDYSVNHAYASHLSGEQEKGNIPKETRFWEISAAGETISFSSFTKM